MSLHESARSPYDEYRVAYLWRKQTDNGNIPDGLGVSLLQAAYLAACEHTLEKLKPSIVRGGRPPRNAVVLLAIVEGAREGIYDHEKVLGQQQTRPIARARFRSWRRLRDLGYSLPGIGYAYQRDHSTVLSGIRSIAKVDVPENLAAGMR